MARSRSLESSTSTSGLDPIGKRLLRNAANEN
jgi:hypothetical protein